jgi:hypothetical protein
MNDLAIAVIGLDGTIACLGLAYWVFRRGRAPTSAVEDPTTVLSREEILAAADRRASEPMAEPATEFLSYDEIFARVGESSASGTEMIPQAEILASASRRALEVGSSKI